MIHLPHTKVTQQTGAAAPQREPRPIQTSFHDPHTQGGRGSHYSKLSWCCVSPRDVGVDHVCPCPISLCESPGLSWHSAAVGQNQSPPTAPAQMNWQRLFSTGGEKNKSWGRASPPSTALSNASPAPGSILIQQFYEKQKSSILIGENSLLPPAEHQSVISLSCKTMFIPDGVCLGTNTRSEMCTHLKTQTLHLILYLLVNPHCSQAPFQNTPTGRRK